MLFPEYLLACAVTYTVGGVIYCLLNPEEAPVASASESAQSAEEDAAQERLA
jgi:hypothetical protein